MPPVAKTVLLSKSDSTRQELALEQKRLAKLWDAFKRQEDDVRAVTGERDDLWARVQEMEKATAGLGENPEKTLANLNHLEKENARLRADVADLGRRLEENRTLFHEEQQRLAKLYKVYEETELDLQAATKQLDKWQSFWDQYVDDLPPKVAQGGSKTTGAKLTSKQLAQRKYAANVKQIRARAAKSPGGKGRIKNRSAARKLRGKLGLKA